MGKRLLDLFTEVDERPPGWRFMKNEGTHCGGLDLSIAGKYPCAVYPLRPEDCRLVEPGSPCCLEARSLGHLGSSVGFTRS